MPTLVVIAMLAATSVAGALLCFVQPLVGLILSNITTIACGFVATRLNIPLARLGYYGSVFGLAASLFLASGSAALAAAALAFGLPLHTVEPVIGRWHTVNSIQPLVGWLLGAALVAVGRGAGWWSLGVVPIGLVGAFVTSIALIGWYVGQRARRGFKVAVGKPMPEVQLPYRQDPGDFSLTAHRGQHVLLCFVRGDWCPICHVWMRIIMREAPLLRRHNVHLLLISPSRGAMDPQLHQGLGIDMPTALDEDARLARQLGLIERQRKGEDVPLPVALLVGPDGMLLDISRPDDVTGFTSESRIARILQGPGPGNPAANLAGAA